MLNLHYVQPNKPSLKSWCRITIRKFFDYNNLYILKENIWLTSKWQNMVLYLLAFKHIHEKSACVVRKAEYSLFNVNFWHHYDCVWAPHEQIVNIYLLYSFWQCKSALECCHLESISANNREVIPSSIPLLFKDNMVIRTTQFQMDSFWCNIK